MPNDMPPGGTSYEEFITTDQPHEEQPVDRSSVLERAKRCGKTEGREWLYAGSCDSYGTDANRVSFYVLQGSPPRGFIIHWHHDHKAVRLDSVGRRIRTFYQ